VFLSLVGFWLRLHSFIQKSRVLINQLLLLEALLLFRLICMGCCDRILLQIFVCRKTVLRLINTQTLLLIVLD
jgi:hypothetical protein